MAIPQDYLERVYAGVLGKLIGVYLGRPFEGWTYQKIMKELGPIEYYVNDRLNQPLVVTDDDVGGSFTFIRALEDYGIGPGLSAEEIGKAWLNYIVEGRTILWWGGRGNSTEHTAYLNLKSGTPAPRSGSIATNGKTVAEQIGAQIFIDGWAMVAPGQPGLAAALAEQAGKVSHDGESVYAAKLWAAMEAEAFTSSDIDHLIDTGLAKIPGDSLVARMIADVRSWRKEHADWREARRLIEYLYGYDKFPGYCHVIPNHALMIMTVLYAPHDFQRAQMIVNTSGWDTDCNAGNVGCLLGIMNGLAGLARPDWRGPVADRMLISSADGGNSINDAVRQTYYIANLGHRLAGEQPLDAPKDGAQFHFSLPGSVQGFRLAKDPSAGKPARVLNVFHGESRALSIEYGILEPHQVISVTSPTFSPREMLDMRTYNLMATPLVYPGQKVKARVVAPDDNQQAVEVSLRVRAYDDNDELRAIDDKARPIVPGSDAELEWTIPDLNGQPIAEIGVAICGTGSSSAGRLILDYLRWDGAPSFTLKRPGEECDFWRLAWVNGVSIFSKRYPPKAFRICQNDGEGIIIHGTRQWTDYEASSEIEIHLGNYAGLAVRVQGLRRYYGARVTRDGKMQIVRVRDERTDVLAEQPFEIKFDKPIAMRVVARGGSIAFSADGRLLSATDGGDEAFRDGGVGLIIHEGAVSTNEVRIGAA